MSLLSKKRSFQGPSVVSVLRHSWATTETITTNKGVDSFFRTITIGTGFARSLGGGGMVFMPARGNVGHSVSTEDMKGQIADLNKERQGGGKTPQERAELDKQIKQLEQKIKANEKNAGERKSRVQKDFVFDPSPSLRFNPAWAPPKMNPTVATVGTIVLLVILKIITGPLPVP